MLKSSYTFNFLQIYQLARDTVVLLLESNPDMGQLLEWVIDRCYTSTPREADACFLALAAIFSARLVKYVLKNFQFKFLISNIFNY